MTVVGAIGPGSDPTLGMVGAHPCMEELRESIRRAAPMNVPVVVWGPTGCGKELVARALHELGPTAQRPFLPVNVAALPETLIESELFGSVRGAFTGAVDRAGLFEAAAGGTVFLDEAEELPQAVQAKLLRAVEYGEVRRVGSAITSAPRFRLVVAIKSHPTALRAVGPWRADFYYRVAAVAIRVPPLRERRSDVPALVAALRARNGLPCVQRDALELMRRVDWPGNVRELAQVLFAAAFLSGGAPIELNHVRSALDSMALVEQQGCKTSNATGPKSARGKEEVLEACVETNWDPAAAARLLGVSLATLYRRLRAFGVVARRERRRLSDASGPLA